jgi:hypothetical protein
LTGASRAAKARKRMAVETRGMIPIKNVNEGDAEDWSGRVVETAGAPGSVK